MKRKVNIGRRFICLLLSILVGYICLSPVQTVYATNSSDRYTVLVLDISSEESFWLGGSPIYTAGTSIDNVKASAQNFINHISYASGNNQVAIVTYYSDIAEVIENPTGNATLNSVIDAGTSVIPVL